VFSSHDEIIASFGSAVSSNSFIPKTLHLVSRRDGGTKSVPIPFDDGIVDADLQFINAYETQDGNVVFDAIRTDAMKIPSKPSFWPWASTIAEFRSQTGKRLLMRYTSNPTTTNSVSKEILSDTQCYFGGINPSLTTSKHRFVYFAAGAMESEVAPPQGIGKLDTDTKQLQTWIPNECEFCGEPMFVAKDSENSSANEDSGYVLSVLFNGKTKESELVILDAANIATGPTTRVPLGIWSSPRSVWMLCQGSDSKS